jgi:peptide/nickel transport system substrate-binding protein
VGKRTISRRDLFRVSGAAAAAALVAACVPPQSTPGGTAAPGGSPAPDTAGKFPLGKLEGATVVVDAARVPKTFKEAPELAALVQQGKLPPVAERIGQDPLVLQPAHGIGRYGGTIRKAFTGIAGGTEATAFRFAAGPDSFVYWDWEWRKLVPNIARSFEQSADGKTLTIQLRRGMRWSDGAPFTTDDVMFWYEDMYLNRALVPAPHADLTFNGKPVIIEKVDQYTFRFVSPGANHLMPDRLASGGALGGQAFIGTSAHGGFAPRHYLSKFHPKYADGGQAAVDKMAADAKFQSWVPFFKERNNWVINTELPVLAPWRTVRPASDTSSFVLERNPYSVWVDTDGNQLPYVGTIQHTIAQNLEVVALRAVAGDYDFQDRHLAVDKLPVLIAGQERGGYKLHLDPEQGGLGIMLNLAYDADPEVGALIRNVDFRRALSMGIDRDQINEAFLLGTGKPGASVPADNNRYSPGREWRTKWATLDVAQANALLDKIGLNAKNAEGYRLRKDGTGPVRLEFTAVNRLADFPQIAEMIKVHWQKIGVSLLVENVSASIAMERINANTTLMTGNNTGSEDVFLVSDFVKPGGRGFSAIMGRPFDIWERSGGQQGTEPFPALKEFMALWQRGVSAPEAERIEIGKEINRIHVDQVFTIGLVGQGLTSYGLRLASTRLGNVPGRINNGIGISPSLNAHPMTFYFK